MKPGMMKNKVLSILRDNPDTRNSDKLLTVYYWKEHDSHLLRKSKDGIDYISTDNFLEATSEAGIGRVRRKIQEPSVEWPNGRYLPTSEEIRKKRKINEECWRAWSQVDSSTPQLNF